VLLKNSLSSAIQVYYSKKHTPPEILQASLQVPLI